MQLKQLVPEEICLKCDTCCHFSENGSIWGPQFSESEAKYLVENDVLPPALFRGHHKNDTGFKEKDSLEVNLIEHESCFICPCLDSSNHKCKIYKHRPFDCRLYPFLLTKKDNKLYLARDKKCPYFDSADRAVVEEFTDYLNKELSRKGAIDFLIQNKELFSEYPIQDLELLFPISIN